MGDVDVILPAGGRISGSFAAEAGTDIKALLRFGGLTLLEQTLRALRATEQVRRVVVIGPDSVRSASGEADSVIPEGMTGPANIFRGLEWLQAANAGRHAHRALIVTTDLPFLSAGAITEFLKACPPEGELCVPIVRREALEARFPGSKNQYVPLRDGYWTMGCVFLVHPAALERSRLLLDRVFAARKSGLAMARLLGPLFILRFLTRRLTTADIERQCTQMLGCIGVAVRDCAPDLAFDIDEPEEYRYAQALIQ